MGGQLKHEPVLATVATGVSAVSTAHEWLDILIAVLTVAWWVRLWIKNPNQRPPGLPTDTK
jgi:hypothetical protein